MAAYLCLQQGNPLKRNFVHVDDLVSCMLAALDNPAAKQQKFNVCMDEPVDYVSGRFCERRIHYHITLPCDEISCPLLAPAIVYLTGLCTRLLRERLQGTWHSLVVCRR